MLRQKTVVVGVSGGIAAYKAVEVVSRLRKLGADVHVIMTRSARKFVQPLTFREISGNPVIDSLWSAYGEINVQHVSLARRADLLAIVPATANILGKIAHGIADDMLTTTVMAMTAPVFIAPAMNAQMYSNPITQENITRLKSLGYLFIEPAEGYLACGEEGIGRLPEPADIVERIAGIINRGRDLAGKRVLVTAGGTQEPIDPVRYIGNRSSGKMGYMLAEAARERGAEVILVAGPVALPNPANVEFIGVKTAREMRDAVLEHFARTDIVIKAAAVADYRPKHVAGQKIKKDAAQMVVELEKNPDILLELGQCKGKQLLAGFAAETQNLTEHALEKLKRKNLDLLVANDVTATGAGFGSDTNIVQLLTADGTIEKLPIMPKKMVAQKILDKICVLLAEKNVDS